MRRATLVCVLVLVAAGCDDGSGGAGGGDSAVADVGGGGAGGDTAADAGADGADGAVARADGAVETGGDASDGSAGGVDAAVVLPTDRVPALVASVIVPGPQTAGGVDIQPAVAVARDGRVGLAWTGSTSDKELGIWFVLLGADGAPVSTAVPLDTTKLGIRNEPSICALGGAGGFVVVWSQDTKQEGANLQVRFRRIDAAGGLVEDEDVRVLTEIPGNHWLGRVACGRDGGFAVTGVRPDADGTFGVFLQRYGADGAVKEAAEAVNVVPSGTQVYPAVGLGPDGLAVVVWDDSQDDVGVERVLGRRLVGGAGSPELEVAEAAKGAAVSVDPTSGAFLAAGVGSAGLELVGWAAGSDARVDVSLPAELKGVQGVAIAPIGETGGHALLALVGGGASVTVRLAVVDASGVVDGPVELAQGKLPPYRPSIAGAAGRIAAAWTESAGQGLYVTRVAIVGGGE